MTQKLDDSEIVSFMEKISSVVLCFFVILASCSSNRFSVEVQKDGFSVTPKYCFANDCYNVIRATMIQLYNDSVPNGSYAYKTTTTAIADGNQEVTTEIIKTYVKGDIVTWDMGDFVGQFNQKTKEIIGIIDKKGDLSQKEIKALKDTLRQWSGLFYPRYASSGDIITYDMNTPIQNMTVTLRINRFVHGLTKYEGRNYQLLETRGGGSLMIEGHKLVMSLSGYTLMDGAINMYAKNVTDVTLRYGNNLERFQMIQVAKEINPEDL